MRGPENVMFVEKKEKEHTEWHWRVGYKGRSEQHKEEQEEDAVRADT